MSTNQLGHGHTYPAAWQAGQNNHIDLQHVLSETSTIDVAKTEW